VDEEPDSRFDGKKGRELWRVFHPVPALECGGVTAISLIHTAPNYPCSYITTWSLCVGSDLFGPLLRCHVEVGNERCWANDEHQEFVQPRIKRDNFTTADNETDTDEQEISRSCLSSFKLNDEASVSGTSVTSASVGILVEKDASEDVSDVRQQAVVSASSSSDLTNINSEASKKSADSALVEDDGESSDFEVIPIPSCFDLTRPFKPSEIENSGDNGDTADSSVDTIAENKEAAKTNEEESVAGTSTSSANDSGELVEAPPMPTLSDLSVSSSSISILNYSASQSMVSTTTNATQEDKVSSSTTTAVEASSSSSQQPSTSSNPTDNSDPVINKLVKTKKIGIKERPIPVPRSVLDADKPFQLQQQEENAQPSTSSPVRKLSKKVNTSRPTNGKEVKSAKPSPSAAAREEGSKPTPPATPSKVKAKTPAANRHAAKLNTLKEMGFSDDQLNKHLLDQFNGDITSVVHALVTHLTGDLNEGEDGLAAPGQLGSRSDNSFMV